MSSENTEATVSWHSQLIGQCVEAGHPVIPDINDPPMSIEWLCDKFAQIDKPAPQIARAKELGLVRCVIRRKACICLSDFWKLFDDAEEP